MCSTIETSNAPCEPTRCVSYLKTSACPHATHTLSTFSLKNKNAEEGWKMSRIENRRRMSNLPNNTDWLSASYSLFFPNY
jgi:hypothetical protein